MTPQTHTYTFTYALTHPRRHMHTYICIYVHPFIHADKLTKLQTPSDGASSQGMTINQLQVCRCLIHMLCYCGVVDQAWESIKYITHMQILTDGMTGLPSQSIRYVYNSLVWRLCNYSGLCAMEGQRDDSFDMRYVLMWQQWLLSACAIMCIYMRVLKT